MRISPFALGCLICSALAVGIGEAGDVRRGWLKVDHTSLRDEAGEVEIHAVSIDEYRHTFRLLVADSLEFRLSDLDKERCENLASNSANAEELKARCLSEFAFANKRSGFGSGALFLSDYYRRTNASLVVSGGEMAIGSYSIPLPAGLVQVDGQVLTPLSDPSILDGVVCLDGPRMGIILAAEFSEELSADCLQTGPILIRFQEISPRLEAAEAFGLYVPARHTFVCVRGNGIVLGISEPVGLLRLANLLVTLDCDDAMRLSSDPIAGVYATGFQSGNEALPVHNAIGVFSDADAIAGP